MSRIVCDTNRCTGCLACVVACIDQHYPDTEKTPVSGRIYYKRKKDSGLEIYVTDSCHHCENPKCLAVCPVHAISKRDNGLVVVESEKCVGCGMCKKACEFHFPQIDSYGKMRKCDGCSQQITNGFKPACVKVCPVKALAMEG